MTRVELLRTTISLKVQGNLVCMCMNYLPSLVINWEKIWLVLKSELPSSFSACTLVDGSWGSILGIGSFGAFVLLSSCGSLDGLAES